MANGFCHKRSRKPLHEVKNGPTRVGGVRVTRSLTPDLDQAAIAAAKQWEFVPAKRDGKPVAVRVPLILEFRLH